MALHLPIGPCKKTNTAIGWSRYRDTNSVPTRTLADDTAIGPFGACIWSRLFAKYAFHSGDRKRMVFN